MLKILNYTLFNNNFKKETMIFLLIINMEIEKVEILK